MHADLILLIFKTQFINFDVFSFVFIHMFIYLIQKCHKDFKLKYRSKVCK